MSAVVLKRMERFLVWVPEAPLLNIHGPHNCVFPRIVLAFFGEGDAAIGYAEIPCHTEAVALLESPELARRLIGRKVDELPALLDEVEAGWGAESENLGTSSFAKGGVVHAIAALRIATLEARSRARGVSAVTLLDEEIGGRQHEDTEFLAYGFLVEDMAGTGLPYPQPVSNARDSWDYWRAAPALTAEAIVEQAGAMMRHVGASDYKLKGGVFSPQAELAIMRALREAYPKARLDLDPNAGWTMEEAHAVLPELKKVVTYLEDPVKGRPGMYELLQTHGVPLATNMCIRSRRELEASVAEGKLPVSILLMDAHYWRGVEATISAAAYGAAHGLTIGTHSNSHLGHSLMVMAVTGLYFRNRVPLDTHYPWVSPADEVWDGVPAFTGGRIVPDLTKPGFGLELNLDRAQRCQQLAPLGELDRNDQKVMKLRYPQWTEQPGRWLCSGLPD